MTKTQHWIPGEPEPDIEDLPGHVFEADAIFDRYAGTEPLVNWATEDLIKLRNALETEIVSRTDRSEDDDTQ